MEPTLTTGSDLVGDESYYAGNPPKRWDVVVFKMAASDASPGAEPARYVKRIIGLPGETIQLTTQGAKVNGKMLEVPALLKDRFSAFKSHDDYKYASEPFHIPKDSVFVIGDNPGIFVADSRKHGAIPIKNLEARLLATVKATRIT